MLCPHVVLFILFGPDLNKLLRLALCHSVQMRKPAASIGIEPRTNGVPVIANVWCNLCFSQLPTAAVKRCEIGVSTIAENDVAVGYHLVMKLFAGAYRIKALEFRDQDVIFNSVIFCNDALLVCRAGASDAKCRNNDYQ